MVHSNRVSLIGRRMGGALRFPKSERALEATGDREITDALAALPAYLAQRAVAEGTEQATIKRQAALNRTNNEVQMRDPGGWHARRLAARHDAARSHAAQI